MREYLVATPRTFADRPPTMTLSRDQLVSRSEEHTSELQSQSNLVCRLLLEKKNNNINHQSNHVEIVIVHTRVNVFIIASAATILFSDVYLVLASFLVLPGHPVFH